MTLFDADDKVPQPETADRVVLALKALAGTVPIVGPMGAAILEDLAGPRLASRRDDWFNDLAERVRRLEAQGVVTIAGLQQNDAFVDAVATAAAAAMRTSSQEKRAALRNAVLNAAIGQGGDQARQQVFLNLTDRFSELHLRMLRFAQDARQLVPAGKSAPALPNATLVLRDTFPDAELNASLYELVWSDLHASGLVRVAKLENGPEGDARSIKRTTELGDQYLAFIRMEKGGA
jgi:hypothetical protein